MLSAKNNIISKFVTLLCENNIFYIHKALTEVTQMLFNKWNRNSQEQSFNVDSLLDAIAYHSEGIIPAPKDLENFIKNKEKELEDLEK